MSSNTILTSLNKVGAGDFSWASGLIADYVNWAPDQPAKDAGDCTGILKLVVSVVPCETVANFVCEDKGVNITSEEQNFFECILYSCVSFCDQR
jgi:hypothetical protein